MRLAMTGGSVDSYNDELNKSSVSSATKRAILEGRSDPVECEFDDGTKVMSTKAEPSHCLTPYDWEVSDERPNTQNGVNVQLSRRDALKMMDTLIPQGSEQL